MKTRTRTEAQQLPNTVAPRSGLLRALPALGFRDFRLLWAGNFFAFGGWWMSQLALGWLVLELTNSAFQVSLVSFFSIIPTLFFSLPGGILADRVDRRRLILLTQSASFIVFGGLAVLVLAGAVQLWHIYVATFATGALMSLNMPARQSLVFEVVSRQVLLGAVALNSAMFNVTRIVGPAIAGVLVTAVGNGGALAVGALGYGVVVFLVAAIHYERPHQPSRGASPWQNLVEGVRYSLAEKTIFAILALVAIPTLLAMPYMAVLPVFARDVLGLDADGLGVLNAAIGVGALTTAGFLALAGDRVRHRGLLLLGATTAFSLLLIAFAYTRWFPLSLLVLVLVGATSFGQLTLTNTLLQMIVPNELRGRVMSLYMLVWGLMPIGTIPFGVVAEVWGTPAAIALGGALSGVATIVFGLLMPGLRKLD